MELIKLIKNNYQKNFSSKSAITCSKLTIEKLEQGLNYVQS